MKMLLRSKKEAGSKASFFAYKAWINISGALMLHTGLIRIYFASRLCSIMGTICLFISIT